MTVVADSGVTLDGGFPGPLSMSWVGFRAGSDRARAMGADVVARRLRFDGDSDGGALSGRTSMWVESCAAVAGRPGLL